MSYIIYAPETGKPVHTFGPANMSPRVADIGYRHAERIIDQIEGAGKHVAQLMFDHTDEFEALVGNYPLGVDFN